MLTVRTTWGVAEAHESRANLVDIASTPLHQPVENTAIPQKF
jgi:hypothetical protein